MTYKVIIKASQQTKVGIATNQNFVIKLLSSNTYKVGLNT